MQLNLHGSGSGPSTPNSAFFGGSLKKVNPSTNFNYNHGRKCTSSGNMKVMASDDLDESKQTRKDKWGHLAFDMSDDQQDITRGKGMVDSLFQAPSGAGTHDAIMNTYDYVSQGLRSYDHMDNMKDGYYIAPAFMDKLVVHIAKNFMTLPNIKVRKGKPIDRYILQRSIDTLIFDSSIRFL